MLKQRPQLPPWQSTLRRVPLAAPQSPILSNNSGGRILGIAGDNILADFTSVIDVVNCALEIQRELAEKNIELSYSR